MDMDGRGIIRKEEWREVHIKTDNGRTAVREAWWSRVALFADERRVSAGGG